VSGVVVRLTATVFLGEVVMVRMMVMDLMGAMREERERVDLVERVACAKEECRVESRLACKQGIRGHRGVMILGVRVIR
jgi:hypothetical protein